MDHVREQLLPAGFEVVHLWDGQVVFGYDTPDEVLEHLLKSGAGMAYYDAVDPARRKGLEKEFVQTLARRRKSAAGYEVIHEYICCIATSAQASRDGNRGQAD
jgi:hypothetical protein